MTHWQGGSDGNLRAPVAIVGRDFGATEAAQGVPFVGRAGHILTRAIGAAGWRREADCWIDNVVPRQPPGNLWERHAPGDVEAGVARLHDLLNQRRPRLIVALGNEALRACLGHHPDDKDALPGIQEARGYLWDGPFGRVLAAVHPAAVDREWTPWRILLDLDFRKARRELDAGCPPFPVRTVHVCAAQHQAAEVAAYTKPAEFLAVDIEGDGETLNCFGLAASVNEAWVIPAQQDWQRALIAEIAGSAAPKVLANGQYDRFALGCHGIELCNQVFDVQLAWHALQPELAGQKIKTGSRKRSRHTEKSLRFLASIFTREPFWKNYEFADADEEYRLNGKDCCVTLEVAEREMEFLEAT